MTFHKVPVVDLEDVRDVQPPLGQNFFISKQFSGKNGQIVGWRPPPWRLASPLGNPGSATEFMCTIGKYNISSKGRAHKIKLF